MKSCSTASSRRLPAVCSLGLLLLARTFHGCVGSGSHDESAAAASAAAGPTPRRGLRRGLTTDEATTQHRKSSSGDDKPPSDGYLNSAFRDFYLSERECGSVIGEYNGIREIQSFIATLLGIMQEIFKQNPPPLHYPNFTEPLTNTFGDISAVSITNGFRSMKICAGCEMFRDAGLDGYDDICGSDVYGSDAMFSGLLLIPMADDEDTVLGGLLKLVVHGHGIQTKTTQVPSADFSESLLSLVNPPTRAFVSFDYLAAIMAAGTGRVVLLPDYMGFAQSNDRYKGLLVKKTYQTATIPLVLRAVKMIAGETGCDTEVADVVYTSGNSEGGYSSIAIADGLQHIGFRVGLAQAGSPIISVKDLTDNVVGGLLNGTFNPTYSYVLPPFSSAYSTTNPDLASYGLEGQNVASDEIRGNAISWTLSQLEIPELRLLMPENVIDVLNPTLVAAVNETGGVCKDPASENLEGLCEAFEENTLTDSYDDQYAVFRCNSPSDDLVGFERTVGTSTLLPTEEQWSGESGNPIYPHLTASIICVAVQGYTYERDDIPTAEDVVPFRFGNSKGKKNKWCRNGSSSSSSSPDDYNN